MDFEVICVCCFLACFFSISWIGGGILIGVHPTSNPFIFGDSIEFQGPLNAPNQEAKPLADWKDTTMNHDLYENQQRG